MRSERKSDLHASPGRAFLLRRMQILGLLALAATQLRCGDAGSPAGDGLRDLVARDRFSIGSAAHDEYLSPAADAEYGAVLAREFDSITPYKAMKWGRIHPEPDRYDFTGAD